MPARTIARPQPVDYAQWLTHVAFYACLVLTLVRLSINEQLRDVFDIGTTAALPPGPSTTLLLDLACVLPALLVLVRRAIDRTYVLQIRASHLPLLLLAAWVAISCAWAGDQFAAVVSAANWCAASAVLWAMSQLVRSWKRFRLVAATAFGALMLMVAQSGIYYFYEAPEVVRAWDEGEKQRVFDAQHWTADNPTAIQFDRRVRQGEVLGFFKSPNTLAAVTLLCATIAAGIALQRVRDGKVPILVAAPAIAAALALPILIVTGSRTAQGLAAIGAVVAVVAYFSRKPLIRHRKKAYYAVVGVAALGGITLILIGLKTGGLVHDSLTFRWRYWVGSIALIRAHPWLGVGWESFGDAYLPYRLPQAVEEIKDPHNALVKFAAETGLVGLALFVGWLLTFGRELAMPAKPTRSAFVPEDALRPALAIVGAFFALHLLTHGDSILSNALLELPKLILFVAFLGGCLLLGSVKAIDGFLQEDRRARWIGGAVTLALLLFLTHNLVDFALFETGPMLLFMTLLGASIGLRTLPHQGKRRTALAITALAISAAGLLSFALLIVVPVIEAESHAATARDLAAKNLPDRATAEWRAAFANAPVPNADYIAQAADVYQKSASAKPAELFGMLSQTISANPKAGRAWLERARVRRSFATAADVPSIENDYRTALKLDPSSTLVRLEFAEFLDSAGISDRALEQYRSALWYSDQLKKEEIRRLPDARAEGARQRIAALEAGVR